MSFLPQIPCLDGGGGGDGDGDGVVVVVVVMVVIILCDGNCYESFISAFAYGVCVCV